MSDEPVKDTSAGSNSDDANLKQTFQTLCCDYAETFVSKNPKIAEVEEKMDTTLFKLEESCALIDSMRHQTDKTQELIPKLKQNVDKLEQLFDTVDSLETLFNGIGRSVLDLESRYQTIKTLQDATSKASTARVTRMLGKFSLQGQSGGDEKGIEDIKNMSWDPKGRVFDVDEFYDELREKSRAKQKALSAEK